MAGFWTVVLELVDGRVINGVKVLEDAATLTLGNDKGEQQRIPRSDTEATAVKDRSTMPDGLEKRFTDQEFLDLLAFLTSEKRSGDR